MILILYFTNSNKVVAAGKEIQNGTISENISLCEKDYNYKPEKLANSIYVRGCNPVEHYRSNGQPKPNVN